MATRTDRGFRFPLQKYSDEKALYANFRYLQQYLNYIRKFDKGGAPDIIIAPSDATEADKFGAHVILDGQNDEVQINTAITSGGWIHVRKGTVYMDANINKGGHNFKLTGAGIQNGTKFLAGHGGIMFSDSGGNEQIIVTDIEFDGNSSSTEGFRWSGASQGDVYFDRVYMHGFTTSVVNLGRGANNRSVFTNCIFSGSSLNSGRESSLAVYQSKLHSVDVSGQGPNWIIGNEIANGIKDTSSLGAPSKCIIIGNAVQSGGISIGGGGDNHIVIGNWVVGAISVPSGSIVGLNFDNSTASVLDHGSLSGLTDDDHTQYLLADGTRNLTAKLEFDEASEPAAPGTDDVVVWAEDEQGFGTLHWKSSEDIAFELSRDRHLVVRNDTGAQINVGEAVYISGSTGVVPNIAKAKADASATMPAIGIAISNIANASFGRIKLAGDMDDLDLSAFTDGDVLYVSAATAGVLTATKPAAGSIQQPVGSVTTAGTGANGVLLVDVGNALVEADIDHGSLSGLSDDDHPQYFSESNSAEISALTLKSPLAAGDHILIEDSAASNAKKRTTVADVQSAETDHGLLSGLADDDHSFYPKGTLGYAEVTTSQTGISAETDLTGLSVAVTAGTSRRLRITGQVLTRVDTADTRPQLGVKEATTFLNAGYVHHHETGGTGQQTIHVSAVITPSSGSHTYKLTLAVDAGTVDMTATSTVPASILVEDIGPA